MTETDADTARRALEAQIAALRPRLHRYCARMTGSAFDGEDVVQEALAKALAAADSGPTPEDMEAWLMRIAHNAAIDFLRRRTRQRALAAASSGPPGAEAADPEASPEARQAAAMALRAFLALPAAQRSCVILMDVLGDALDEIGGMLGMSLAATKAALHRGRGRLREAAAALERGPAPALSPAQLSLWRRYADRFNARDFDAIRDLLAEEVWLDMVARTRMKGPDEIAGRYLPNYGKVEDWRLQPGVVDGRPALLVSDPADPAANTIYFIELTWEQGRVTRIRDFRYARYVTDGAEAHLL